MKTANYSTIKQYYKNKFRKNLKKYDNLYDLLENAKLCGIINMLNVKTERSVYYANWEVFK